MITSSENNDNLISSFIPFTSFLFFLYCFSQDLKILDVVGFLVLFVTKKEDVAKVSLLI